MITCDTSVLVAAFARWHDSHDLAVTALERTDAVIDHAVVETFSVLTRLPAPRRAPAEIVGQFMDHHFTDVVPRLPGPGSAVVLQAARAGGITGGAVYDLLVALSAASTDATLLSLDRRAATTYDAAGIRFELLGTAG